MTLKDFLEVSFGHIEINIYHFDEHAHIKSIELIFDGYTFEALNSDLPFNNKVNIIASYHDNIIYVGIYDAEDTEKLSF